MSAGEIDIYRVGFLHDLAMFTHTPDRATARRSLRCALRYPIGQAKAGNWRNVRNYFNGYLAEHPTAHVNAGHGWTRGRAYRDLTRNLGSLGSDL